MGSLDSRLDDFMQAPAAAAMFVLADRLGLNAERLAEPATLTALASTALRDLNPWDPEAAANRVRVLALVQPLCDLVTAVVTDLRNAWWSEPLDHGAQLLLTGQSDPQRDPMHLQAPEGQIDPRRPTHRNPCEASSHPPSCRSRPMSRSALARTRS